MPFEITNIKMTDNNSSKTVSLINRENADNNYTLPANSNVVKDIWIPWVNSKADFNLKAIVLDFYNSKRKYYIWQTGQRIRYSTKGYGTGARAIPGDSQVGRDKKLIINERSIRLSNND